MCMEFKKFVSKRFYNLKKKFSIDFQVSLIAKLRNCFQIILYLNRNQLRYFPMDLFKLFY